MPNRYPVEYEGTTPVLRATCLNLAIDGYYDLHATTSDYATNAGLATVATTATYATSAGTAATATYATTAGSATPLAHAASHITGGSDPLALTKAQVGLANVDNTSDVAKPVSTAQANADNLRVLKAGDTMTGDLVISDGKLLRMTGGNAIGEGNVRFEAAASGSYDTNLLHVDAKTRTMGMIASDVAAFGGANGPYVCLRGNTYSAVGGQAGMLSLGAGDVAGNGSITFYTANDLIRMKILRDGTTIVYGALSASGGVKVGASGTVLTQVKVYTPTLTPTSVANDTTEEQSYSVPGLTTSDTVLVTGPTPTAGTALGNARVAAEDTLVLTWVNVTGGARTPASGTYRVLAVRN